MTSNYAPTERVLATDGADGRIAQVIKVGTDGEDSDLLILCIAKRLQVNGIEEQIRDPAKTLAEIVEP